LQILTLGSAGFLALRSPLANKAFLHQILLQRAIRG